MSQELPCPNCGGPITLALGSSWAVICPWCRFSVMRTDRDLRALGKVADLAPTGADFALGDTVTVGGDPLLIAGRVQLDHGRGPWDEWYVQHTRTGRWAWLAKAQGQWLLTYPQRAEGLPAWEQMRPGQSGALPGTQGSFTVAEQGHSRVVSAEGELPLPVVSGQQGRYVDLSGPGGAFATIDYGDGQAAPMLYAGRALQPAELSLDTEAMGPRPLEKATAERLRCPTCGAPVPILAPEITERAVCGSCNSLLDYTQGKLGFLEKLSQHRKKSAIPLGAEATLFGEKVTCIGYMERSTRIHGERFQWREYLLYGEQGYRWLMEDMGHWTWLRPAAVADVSLRSMRAQHGGRSHVLWNVVHATVDYVVGEFYWRVTRGEQARLSDYIKPPHVVSEERTGQEVVYSSGTYLPGRAVWEAFGIEGKPPATQGVGLTQPNPHALGFPLLCALVATVALFVLMGAVKARHASDHLVNGPIPVPVVPASGPSPDGRGATVTPPFEVRDGPTLIDVHLSTNAENQYIGVPAALIEQNTGEVIEFYVDAERYHGVSGGESWSEGSASNSVHVEKVPSGIYALRVDPFWTSFPQPGAFGTGLSPPAATIRVESGATSVGCLILALVLLWLPALLLIFRHSAFEKKRQELKTV